MRNGSARGAVPLDSLPFPAAAFSSGGECLSRNAAFGQSFQAVSGFPFEDLAAGFLPFLDNKLSIQFSRRFDEFMASAEPTLAMECPVRLPDGSQGWLRFRLGRYEEGNAARALLVMEDTSAQKRREEGLLAAKESAERAMAVRSRFIANMSHEIRTPIQTILGMLELLEETTLDHEQQEYARQAGFSAEVLLTLINDILDFSKIEAGKLVLEAIDFNVRDCVEQSVDMISLEAHRKGLELVLDMKENLPALINGDPSRLRQVIVNLVKNAVKFTTAGEVLITACLAKDSGGHDSVRFEVADTGIGISPEIKANLFTSFYQADSSHTRKYGGTGLGLAISKQLIDSMGGTIGLKDNVDSGSVFFFQIPLVNAAYSLPDESTRLSGRALIVDDRFSARRAEVSLARFFGMEADGVLSGAAALECLLSAAKVGNPYDICVIDQNMPGMDGWRLAAEISSKESISPTKLVLMSPEGTIGPDAKMKLLNWFNGYVAKPVKLREFRQALAKAIGVEMDLETVGEGGPADGPSAVSTVSANVLIAEDHPVNQELFKVILERSGCDVTVAQDGSEAVELNRRRPFDIIFMDIQMPRMNGYEAAQAIRRSGSLMPIIAVTAHSGKDEREKCAQAGMNDILTKPFRKADIRTMLEFWLKHGISAQESQAVPAAEEAEPDSRFSDPGVFDFNAVVETFLGNKETVVGLLSKFLGRTKESVRAIDAALESGDYAQIAKEAHSIKGSSWNLSARRMGDASFALEEAARSGDARAVEEAVERLREEFFEFAQYAQFFVTKSY